MRGVTVTLRAGADQTLDVLVHIQGPAQHARPRPPLRIAMTAPLDKRPAA